jgi:selenoprotein W-related protein
LRGAFAAEVELLASSGGVFEVVADGRLVFSKKQLGRFPEEGEVANLLQAMK